jgi:hypothetical protein
MISFDTVGVMTAHIEVPSGAEGEVLGTMQPAVPSGNEDADKRSRHAIEFKDTAVVGIAHEETRPYSRFDGYAHGGLIGAPIAIADDIGEGGRTAAGSVRRVGDGCVRSIESDSAIATLGDALDRE